MTQFYTYLWLREDGTPYYVGKGKENRAWVKHKIGKTIVCPPPKERIVMFPSESEVDALETEVALIWYYGRADLGLGCLRNFTDGGENPPSWAGVKQSSEHVAKRVSTRRANGGYKGNKKDICKRGHLRIPENVDGNGMCRICIREKSRKNYSENKGKYLDQKKRDYIKHKDERNSKSKKYYLENKERIKDRVKNYELRKKTKEVSL